MSRRDCAAGPGPEPVPLRRRCQEREGRRRIRRSSGEKQPPFALMLRDLPKLDDTSRYLAASPGSRDRQEGAGPQPGAGRRGGVRRPAQGGDGAHGHGPQGDAGREEHRRPGPLRAEGRGRGDPGSGRQTSGGDDQRGPPRRPRTGAFATLLLEGLRKKGFTYFAAETFGQRRRQGTTWPRWRSAATRPWGTGYYSNEPFFGDLVRTACGSGSRRWRTSTAGPPRRSRRRRRRAG